MEITLSDEVLALLVCPETGQSLRLAGAAELAAWQSGTPFEGALVTEDGSKAYPVREGFPVVVMEEALVRVSPPETEA